MGNKKTLFLFFILLQTLHLMAQNSRFKEGETLYIWATSGMNLRQKPDAKAAKLATIPLGSKVIVQPNVGVNIPFEVEAFKDFTVKGYWLLVKYDNTEGYVFDGFLSKLPAPISQKEEDGIETYLDKSLGKIGNKYDVKIWDEKLNQSRPALSSELFDKEKMEAYKQKYKQNTSYAYSSGEGSSGFTIEFSNLSLYEGYFLLKTYMYDPESEVFSFNKEKKSINLDMKEEGAGCSYDVQKKGNKIIISGGCGC
jgi:3D (Asp-Asp-Asp) domain-containing protein